MNSFEQIKALLELKEKGAISDAEFKQMLAIIEAESKKEEKSESSNSKESQNQAEYNKQKSGKAILQLNHKKPLRKTVLVSAALIIIGVGITEYPFKANDNSIQTAKNHDKNPKKIPRNPKPGLVRQKFLNHRVIRSNEIQGFQKHFGIVFLQYSEKGDYRKADSERDLNKPESIIKDANLITLLNNVFGLNVLSYESDLKKLYSVLSRNGYYTKTFVEFQKQWQDQGYRRKVYHVVFRDGIYTKSEDEFLKKYSYQPPKQIINSNSEEIKKQHLVVEPITRQNQNLITALSEFPEKFIFEAEKLGRIIWDEKVNSAYKKAASKQIMDINRDYVSNQNIKWKVDPIVQRRLERCYIVAVNYNQ